MFISLTIGHVHKLVRAIELDLILEQDALDKTGMQFSNSVDSARHAR
jgi:hypothetical protein